MEVMPSPQEPIMAEENVVADGTNPPAARRSLWAVQPLLQIGLLAVVLVVHFLSRQHLATGVPVPGGYNYPFVYRTSLCLLAGKGFHAFRFSDAPESAPVVAFLNGERKGVTRQEFRRFLSGPDAKPIGFPLPDDHGIIPLYAPGGELKTPVSPLETSRVWTFIQRLSSGASSASAGRFC